MSIEEYQERYIDRKPAINEVFMGVSTDGLIRLKNFALYDSSRREERCVLFLTPYNCEVMDKIAVNAGNEGDAQNLAKTYFELLILNQLSKENAQKMRYLDDSSIEVLNKLFDYCNVSKIMKNSRWSNTYREIVNLKKQIGSLELDIFMTGMKNKYLQREINSYLSKKDIKTRVWSDKESFSTYIISDRGEFLVSNTDFKNCSCEIPLEYNRILIKD